MLPRLLSWQRWEASVACGMGRFTLEVKLGWIGQAPFVHLLLTCMCVHRWI